MLRIRKEGPFSKDTELTIDFRDESFHAITGTVLNEIERPLAGCRITSVDEDGKHITWTKTDKDGKPQRTGRAKRAADYADGYFASATDPTLYDAFSAVAAWFDFGQWDGSRRRDDTRFSNSFRGDGAKRKRAVWASVLALADELSAQ